MRRRIVYEPTGIAVIAFFIYLSTMGMLFGFAAMGGCGWRGACSAPTEIPFLFMVFHWPVVGIIFKRSVRLAGWLMVAFASFPLFLLIYGMLFSNVIVTDPYNLIVFLYLIVAGGIFPVYVFSSKRVAEYEAYHKNA